MMTTRRFSFSLILAAVMQIATAQVATPQAPKYQITDGHFHFLNFVQETAGMDALFKALDDAGVTDSMISGMSLVKKWDEGDAKRPGYYLDNDSRTYWY